MSDLWFRGEAIGVTPATPGSTAPHDLGDGMYVTDNEESAKAYAQLRSSDASKHRVYSVRIARSSLRVLDLTTDPRWQKFVQPVEHILRSGTSNENYGRTFKNFAETHKIDLNQYDAVIGHDYVRGGKQMVVLHKKGRPTRLHTVIRKMFRLASTPIRTLPKIKIKMRPLRIMGGIRARGVGTVGGVAINVALAVLKMWLDKKSIEKEIKSELKQLEPKIEEKLENLKPEIGKLQLLNNPGDKVFANVTIQIHWLKMSLGAGRGSYMNPEVWLKDVNVTTTDITNEKSFDLTLDTENVPRVKRKVDQYTHSFEAGVYSDAEVEIFRDLEYEYLSYNRRLRMDPSNLVFIGEVRRLRETIRESFELDVWFLDDSFAAKTT